jgi:hypothetical protein
MEILLRHLLFFYYGALSLTRGQMCSFQCSNSSVGASWNSNHTLMSHLRLRSQYLYPWGRTAQLYPPALGSLFIVCYSSQGCDGGILSRLHTVSQMVSLKIKIILRKTISRPVCPGIRLLPDTRDQFFFHFHGNFVQRVWSFLLGGLSKERTGLSL